VVRYCSIVTLRSASGVGNHIHRLQDPEDVCVLLYHSTPTKTIEYSRRIFSYQLYHLMAQVVSRRPINPRPVHVEFVVEKVVIGQNFF
jgi:hypothetical protein